MHRHSPTAPQRYPCSSRRQTVIDEQTASTSCEPPWTSGNARSPPPQRPPDRYHPHQRRSVARRPLDRCPACGRPRTVILSGSRSVTGTAVGSDLPAGPVRCVVEGTAYPLRSGGAGALGCATDGRRRPAPARIARAATGAPRRRTATGGHGRASLSDGVLDGGVDVGVVDQALLAVVQLLVVPHVGAELVLRGLVHLSASSGRSADVDHHDGVVEVQCHVTSSMPLSFSPIHTKRASAVAVAGAQAGSGQSWSSSNRCFTLSSDRQASADVRRPATRRRPASVCGWTDLAVGVGAVACGASACSA